MTSNCSTTTARPRIVIIGSGTAFEADRPNTSILLDAETRLLIDCGFSVPPQLWRLLPDPQALDGLYISHLHGDHVFGVPALLGRMREDGRQKPLTVFGQVGTEEHVQRLVRLAFPNLLDELGFSLEFVALPPGPAVAWQDLQLRCARSRHSLPNYALRVEVGSLAVCYSGDGQLSRETRALYQDAAVLVHEAYSDDGRVEAHASVHEVVAAARAQGVRTLCLVHLSTELRTRIADVLAGYRDHGLDVRAPEPGDVIDLPDGGSGA